MAKRLSAVDSSDNHCKRKRTTSPVKACEEYAENYEFKKKYATESEDDSANSVNKKRQKVDGRVRRRRHCAANAKRTQHYYRASTSGGYMSKSYAQSSESVSTTDSETTVSTTSSCESRQSHLANKQKQSSNENLYNPKTEFKHKRIAGGAKKSIKRKKIPLETPTDNAPRLVAKRDNVRAQTVRTENADENTNNGTTKEMVRFMNKLLISLGNVENSFSAAVNSVSANRQKILNNKSAVNYANVANNLAENYTPIGAKHLPQKCASDAQPTTLKIKSQKSPNTSRDEREFQYASQSAASQSQPPLKTHAITPTVHFNTQLPSTSETPNYISTHSPQFNVYGPTPTAVRPTSDLPQLPHLSTAQQAALPAIQILNAFQRTQPNVNPTNQHPEFQPYHNGLPVFTNDDAKAGNEYAYLNRNPTLNQNPNIPADAPNRPYNNLTQFEVGSVAVEQNMALPRNIQTYYNSIDYNGGITEPQINGNYREMHENETSQRITLNRGSISERQSKANRGTISDRGTGILNGQNKGSLLDRGSISNGETRAQRGNTKSETNKAYGMRGQSDSADANGEYSNGNEAPKRTHNERISRVSRTSALDEMFAENNAANEMRRRTTSNGKKFNIALEKNSEESQSDGETSCSCKSDYIRKRLRRQQAEKHNKYADKQRAHVKNRRSHYKDAYSDSESDEAYPRSSYQRTTQRYKYYADSASSDAVSYSLSRTSCRELKHCCSRIVAICRMARDTAGTQTEQYWGDSTTRLGKLNKMDDGVPQAIVDGLATANPKVVEQIMQMLRKRRKCKVCACGVTGDNGAQVVKDDMIVLKFEENEPMLPPVMCIDERSRSSCCCATKLAETESEIIRDIIRKKRLLEKSQRIKALTNTGKYTSCDGLSTCTCVDGQDEMEFVEGLLRRSRSERDRPVDSTSTGNMNSNECDCTTRKAKELATEIMNELVQGHMQKMFVDKIENKTRHDGERVSSKSADTIVGLSNEHFAAENSCACGKSSQGTMLTKDARESIKSRAGNCTCNADESAMRMRKSKRTTYWADADDGSSMMFQNSERSNPLAGECTCHGDENHSMMRRSESIVPRAGECTCHGAGNTWTIRRSESIAPQAGECTCNVHESTSLVRKSGRIVPRAGECTCNRHESASIARNSERIMPRAGECTCNRHESASVARKSERIVPRAGECTCNRHESASVARNSERIVPRAGECTCAADQVPIVSRRSHRNTHRPGECTCYTNESKTELAMSERIKAAVTECTSNSDDSITVIRISGRPRCTCNADDNPPKTHQGMATQRETVVTSNIPRYSKFPKHSISAEPTRRSTERARETMTTEYQTLLEESLSQERQANAIPRSTVAASERESELPMRASARRSDYTGEQRKNAYTSINEEPQPPRNSSSRELMRESKDWERKSSAFPKSLDYPAEQRKNAYTSISEEPQPPRNSNSRELMRESKDWERKSSVFPKSLDYPAEQKKNAYTSITEEPQPYRNGSARDVMRETEAWEHKGSVFPRSLASEPSTRASNRQSEYQGEHRKTTKDSTMDISLGESEIKDSQRKSNINSQSSSHESGRISGVIEGASDRRSEYQAQPRITASKSMIIEPQRQSQNRSREFADMGEDKTADFEMSRKYSTRESSFTDNERKRSTLETKDSKPIELGTMDTDQRKSTKHQLIIPSETDSGNVEETAGALKKSIINETPRITDYTQVPRRETNTEIDPRPKKYEERYVGEYEEPTGASNYGTNKCRTDCGCKIVGTALHTRSKDGELEDVHEYEERIMARANSIRPSRPANYAATMYNPESDYTKALREGKASPYEEAMAVVHNNGQQKDRPHPAIEDDGLSRATTDHGSMQKFVIDIKACKQATASCTLTAYPRSTNKNPEHKTSRSIARADAENNECDLRMKQRAALCAELTMNELLPQHSLRTLLTKLSSPQGKAYAQNEFPEKEQFNPTIFRAQTLQTMDSTFKQAAEVMRQIQIVDRNRDIKLALSAPSIITRRQHSAINGPVGTQSKAYKKSFIPLPVGSRRPATSSMLLMQNTSAERRANSRPLINQSSDSNHQITRLYPKQTKTGTETKQQEQPGAKPAYNRDTNRAYLATEKNERSASDMQLSYDTGYTDAHPRLSSGRHKEIQTNSSIFSCIDMRQQSSENIKRIRKNSQADPRTPKMVNILSAAKQQHNSSSALSSASSESRKSAASQSEYKPRNGHCKAFYKRTGRHHNLRNPFSGYAACNEPPQLLKTARIVATKKKRRESDRSRTVSDGEQTNSDVECITVEYASSDAAFQDTYAQYQAELQRQQELWRIDNVREAIKVEEQEAERAKNQLRTTLTGELLERAMHYPTRVWNEERKQLNLQRNGATIFGPL